MTNANNELTVPYVPVREALRRLAAASASQPRREVHILGAGLAGLGAGLELRRLGHTVHIYEASDRVGGRAHTHRFPSGQYGELGPMRVYNNHDYTHNYIRECGLELRPFVNNRPEGFFYLRGERLRENELKDRVNELYPDLTQAEREVVQAEGLNGLMKRVFPPLLDSLTYREKFDLLYGNLTDENTHINELDKETVRNRLNSRFSPDAVELIGEAMSLDAIWSWSLAMFLRDELMSGERLEEIVGGFDLLPSAMAARLSELGGSIHFGKRVARISVDKGAPGSSTTTIHFNQGQPLVVRSPDQVLCTLPFPVLRRLQLDGAFSPDKLRSIRNMEYASATKVLIHCSERFWEQGPSPLPGGRSTTDRLSRQTYYPSDNAPPPPVSSSEFHSVLSLDAMNEEPPEWPQPVDPSVSQGPGVLLASYSLNYKAGEIVSGSREETIETVVEDLSAMHPELREKQTDCKIMVWDENPLQRGAFAITPPGDLTHYFLSGRSPEGNLYFAGEHLSIAQGWMQGALESGLREAWYMLSPDASYPPPPVEE